MEMSQVMISLYDNYDAFDSSFTEILSADKGYYCVFLLSLFVKIMMSSTKDYFFCYISYIDLPGEK